MELSLDRLRCCGAFLGIYAGVVAGRAGGEAALVGCQLVPLAAYDG